MLLNVLGTKWEHSCSAAFVSNTGFTYFTLSASHAERQNLLVRAIRTVIKDL